MSKPGWPPAEGQYSCPEIYSCPPTPITWKHGWPPPSTPWLSGWKYRKKHEIDGSTAGAVSDYQVRIVVHYGSGTDDKENVYLEGKCKNDFGDVRFTASDGKTLLPYEYEAEGKVDGDYAIYWVKIPNIPASPDKTYIYIYYGNPDAVYDGNPDQVFEFFDDFETDLSKWTIDTSSGGGTIERTNEIAKYGNYSLKFNQTKSGLGTGIHAIANVKWPSSFAVHLYWRAAQTNGRASGCPSIEFADLDKLVHLTAYEDGIYKYYDVDWHDIFNYQADVWYKVEIRVNKESQKFDLLVDDGNTASLTGAGFQSKTIDSDDLHLSTFYATGVFYFDQVFVRKYIDPEPSHGAWYPEESA